MAALMLSLISKLILFNPYYTATNDVHWLYHARKIAMFTHPQGYLWEQDFCRWCGDVRYWIALIKIWDKSSSFFDAHEAIIYSRETA